MSQHFDSMALGDEVEVKGPVGHFVYTGRSTYALNSKPGELPGAAWSRPCALHL